MEFQYPKITNDKELRDFMAGLAMVGMLAGRYEFDADSAYKKADLMLKARQKKQ